jgi:hypothetical protein
MVVGNLRDGRFQIPLFIFKIMGDGLGYVWAGEFKDKVAAILWGKFGEHTWWIAFVDENLGATEKLHSFAGFLKDLPLRFLLV